MSATVDERFKHMAFLLLIVLAFSMALPLYRNCSPHCGEKCKACLGTDNLSISPKTNSSAINESDFKFCLPVIIEFYSGPEDMYRPSPVFSRIEHPPRALA